MKEITSKLKDLGFSSNESKVYVSLTQLGEAKASHIAKKAGLTRTTAISILDRLHQDNYITTHKYKGTIYYWIESPSVITEIFQHKTQIADQLSHVLSDLYRSDRALPGAEVFDTKTSIKNFIEKLMIKLPKDSTIYTIDSPHMGNYRKVLSDDFNKLLVDIKSNKSITTHTLIPFSSYDTIEDYKINSQAITLRELPPNIQFDASVWFIEDMLVLFSGSPPFIVAIKHQLIVKSMKSIYDFLWQISKPA